MVRRQRGSGGIADVGPLVPAAAAAGQDRLEAALLLAVNRAMAGLRRRGHPLRPTALVHRVQPDPRATGLHVHDAGLDGLLAEALPTIVGGRVRGVAGLRAFPGRDHLDLRSAHGQVRLLGVTRERWRQAVAAGVRVDLALSEDLDEREVTTAPGGPVALMSGVLRRLPLWRGALWLHCVPAGNALELYWRGGPPGESIAAILTGSVCAIPGATAVAHGYRETVRAMALSTDGTPCHGEPEWAWTQWVASTAPGPAVPERAVRPESEVDLPDVWEHDDMRDALASRDIGTVYRLLRHHGVPVTRIAALTGQTGGEVEQVLDGRRVDAYDTLAHIAKGLGIPPGYMGMAYDEPPSAAVACRCGVVDERRKREAFLTHAALVTIGRSGVSEPWSCRC
ncbi:hypothetical protein GCM10022243_60480 [Saccharothrix violaceirubra]